MARTGASASAHLKRLRAALPNARKAGKGGKTLTFVPMMELLGFSTRKTLQGWVRDIPGFEESGAFVRGAEGVDYQFDPVATIKYLISYFEKQEKSARMEAQRIRRIVAGDALRDAPEDYDLDQLQKMLRLSRELREERAQWGKLVEADHVAKLLRAMFGKMQATATKALSAKDPTNRLAPEHREMLDDAFANVLETMLVEGEKVLGKLSGGTAQS